MAKFDVNNVSVETLLGYVNDGTIAIPEIQRPFVWDTTKVRDLIDSLYREYPVGYIITWKSPDVKLKDGSASEGKQVLIDGQQRVTALTAALLGQEVLDSDYKKKNNDIYKIRLIGSILILSGTLCLVYFQKKNTEATESISNILIRLLC